MKLKFRVHSKWSFMQKEGEKRKGTAKEKEKRLPVGGSFPGQVVLLSEVLCT